MATPFSISGSLSLPGDVGLPNDPIPIGFSSSYDNRAEVVLNLSGSGTKAVPFGSVAKAKGFLIKVDAASLGAVSVQVNGVVNPIEVSPGGFVAFGSPSPSTGITQLDIIYTSDATVRVWVLG